jgi:tetratricopeptide (TPR) repeat protein
MTEAAADMIDLDGFAKHGLELYGTDQKQEAIELWHDLLAMNPNHQQCQHYLDIALIDCPPTTKPTLVKVEQERDTVNEGRSFDELYFAAMGAYSQRNYSAAELLFKQCLALAPDDDRIRHNLERLINR